MEAVMDKKAVADIVTHFNALSSVVPLHPIRTSADYAQATKAMNRLLDVGAADEHHPLADLVATRCELIGDYDNKHYQIGEVLPPDMLRSLMTQHHLTQSDFPEIGSQGVVSEILSGRRTLNARQIRALADRFGVSPAAFL